MSQFYCFALDADPCSVPKVLNDYYAKGDKAHASADGAGSGIIGMLEVAESDFSKGLAEMTAAEDKPQGAGSPRPPRGLETSQPTCQKALQSLLTRFL